MSERGKAAAAVKTPSRLGAVIAALLCAMAGLIGMGMLAGAWAIAVDTQRLLHDPAVAQAVVEDLRLEYATGRGGGTRNVVYYTFADGAERIEGREAVSEERYAELAVGDSVEVLYEPGNPDNRALRSEFGVKEWLFLPLTMCGFGLLMLLIGVYGVYHSFKLWPRAGRGTGWPL